jgi:hypothetical protein
MYSGKQTLRLEKFKASDIGGLDKELKERKGSGKYDSTRTPYNVELINYDGPTLASSTFDYLYTNNINYNPNKKNTKVLNGLIISSGQEFFEHYGMEFKDTGEFYKTGDNAGKPIRHVIIDDNHKLPTEIKRFFDESLNFISNFVGKENIRYAAIHLDESTPHLHIYFTPVVNEVKRKVFELDENGHQLKHEITNKKGEKKLVPIQKKDDNGKNIYETVKGKFLNSDQFWKQKGGNASYTLLQDDYNEFIKSKGFNLFRGEIGGDKTHLTNAMKQQIELNALNQEIKQENELLKESNKAENEFLDKVDTEKSKDILNPVKKGILKQYKDEDIDNLSTYSKELIENNLKKDIEIRKLTMEVNNFKSGKTYKDLNRTINNQEKTISRKDDEINMWKNKFDELTNEFKSFKKKIQNKIYDLTSKIFEILHIPYNWSEANDIDYAIEQTDKYYRKHHKTKNDFER